MLPLLLASISILRLFGIPIVLIILILWIIRRRKLLSDIEEVKNYIYNDTPKVVEDTDSLYLT